MAKGIPTRRFWSVLWGDRDMAASGPSGWRRPVSFVGRMEGGRGSGPGLWGEQGLGRPPGVIERRKAMGAWGPGGSCRTPGEGWG